MWKRRQRKIKVFSRVNMVPVNTKLFYQHLLLIHIEAPTLIDDLFCFQDTIHPTYKVICIARGLLQDDVKWDNCLQEATVIALPRQIRQLFAMLLVFNRQPLDPLGLLKRPLTLCLMIGAMIKTTMSIDKHLQFLDVRIVDFVDIQDLNEFGYSNVVDVGSNANDKNDLDNSNINFIEEDVGKLND